jgi:rubrerythrin
MSQLNLEKVIPSLIKAEQNDRNLYKKFASQWGQREDIRKLFLSIADQEEDHVKTLKELLEDPAYQKALAEEVGKKEDLQKIFSEGKGDIPLSNINDLLSAMSSREEGRSKLYSYLSSKIVDENTEFLFTNLAFEEKKHHNWIMDRYELEMLSNMG